MQIRILIIALFFAGVQYNASAQDFSGSITYQTASTIVTKIDSSKVSSAQQNQVNEAIRKSMQKEYVLQFNKQESLYKQVERLEAPSNNGGLEVIGVGSGSEGGIYKNLNTHELLETRDGFGKLFLVKDTLIDYNWKLEPGTKQIGNYTCQKASAVREVTFKTKATDSTGKTSTVEKKIKSIITAWYCPDIPINQGPAQYWGLPGLILELNDGRLRILCASISLNPLNKIAIKKPSKGEVVTQAQFTDIYSKKLAEMQEMYQSKHKKP